MFGFCNRIAELTKKEEIRDANSDVGGLVWFGLVFYVYSFYTMRQIAQVLRKLAFCPNYFCLFDEMGMCVLMLGCVAKETKNSTVFDKGDFYQMFFRKILYN